MVNKLELTNIAGAGAKAGLKPEETRKIIDGSLFSEADRGLLGLLKDSLKDPKRREQLLDILESRSQAPVPLSEIIDVLDRFSKLKKGLIPEITEADIKLLRFTIKYFEAWFLSGDWTRIPERKEARQYAYFSVPAGIINMISKIKEDPDCAKKLGELGNLDRERLTELQQAVHEFAISFLSPERLKAAIADPSTSKDGSAAQKILFNRRAIMHTFLDSEKSVKHEFRPQGNTAGDLYFLRTCLVAAEVLRQQQAKSSGIFMPDKSIGTPINKYELFDFSNGENPKHNSMRYSTFRLPYAKFVVEYLRHLSAQD